jgi:hypothetical protein
MIELVLIPVPYKKILPKKYYQKILISNSGGTLAGVFLFT